eukprot:767327-Hanusia_phi.AAC.5
MEITDGYGAACSPGLHVCAACAKRLSLGASCRLPAAAADDHRGVRVPVVRPQHLPHRHHSAMEYRRLLRQRAPCSPRCLLGGAALPCPALPCPALCPSFSLPVPYSDVACPLLSLSSSLVLLFLQLTELICRHLRSTSILKFLASLSPMMANS